IVPCVLPGCQCGNLCSTVFPGVCSALHQYYFVDKSLTWSDAQSHCRQYGGDLATVHGPENQTRLVEVARKYNSHVWIGLYDDVESWTWSLSENANYSGGEVEPWSWPWRGHQPNNWEATEGCIAINRTTWLDANCNNQYSFSCFDNDTKDVALSDSGFVYINEKKSWWDAQSYCREHHTDLPSIRNIEENKMVSNMNAPTLIKWIGLHRNLWSTWSDGSDTSYRDWKAGMPKNSHGTMTNCALAQTDYGWQWSDYPCQNKYKFICSVVPAMKKSFRLKFRSADIDPNDPELSEAILKQLHGKLKEKMVNEDLNLTWTKAPDGEIFHNTRKDEKQQHPEFADARCPLKVD
ncbi:macrophage mannose receptor 1-like, partial [Gadus morhua]|uniref:macrophage mannose receptor 1-like n=1 Tax=Gadus morhua TaxID=8049 RepID=UPI0011B50077